MSGENNKLYKKLDYDKVYKYILLWTYVFELVSRTRYACQCQYRSWLLLIYLLLIEFYLRFSYLKLRLLILVHIVALTFFFHLVVTLFYTHATKLQYGYSILIYILLEYGLKFIVNSVLVKRWLILNALLLTNGGNNWTRRASDANIIN